MFLLISHDFVLVGDNDKRKALVIALDERLKSLSGGCGRLPVAVVRAAFNFKDLNAQQFARAGARVARASLRRDVFQKPQ